MANGYEPTVYYYNPNIFPEKEYLIRKNEITEYAKKLGVPAARTQPSRRVSSIC